MSNERIFNCPFVAESLRFLQLFQLHFQARQLQGVHVAGALRVRDYMVQLENFVVRRVVRPLVLVVVAILLHEVTVFLSSILFLT